MNNNSKFSLKERFREFIAKRRMRKLDKGRFKFVEEKKKSRKWIIIPVIFTLLIALAVYTLYDNGQIEVEYVTVTHSQIPKSFDDFKILQVSDLHGKRFGENNSNLIDKINGLDYDMILFTGDYMSNPDDGDCWDMVDLITALEKKDVPMLYILGESDYLPENVDKLSDSWNMCIIPDEKNELMTNLEALGVQFVYPITPVYINGEAIFFTGIEYKESIFDEYDFDVDKHFSICVTHKPIDYDVNARLEYINKQKLTEVDYDLSISGHTHGGQVRLPLLGAVYIEGKGFFPQEKDSEGLHSDGQGRFNYISKGLGSSGFPGFRFCNTPELSVITLNAM